MKRHIAIYHTWPELKNAEYENVLRIIEAARRIKLDVTLVDNQGYTVFSTAAEFKTRSSRISHKDCDFAISLHFESPKMADMYSYYALWNPLDFYFTWGYEKSIRQFMTHDDLLSCDSDLADAHAISLYSAVDRAPPLELPRMHHSLSGEVIRPNVSAKSRAFYIGINWERINNTRGRHHDLLVALDKAEMIDIYGPELFHGVRPWEGFSCYRGSIPFDGKSTIQRIADAGICLAFSSAAHQRSGIMSNRLFEGLAGGALVIANKHPFIDKFFGDLIPVVDDAKPQHEVVAEVKQIIEWARANPKAANEKAQAAQEIFVRRFALEQSLTRLLDNHEDRVKSRRSEAERALSATAIILFTELRLSRFAEMIDDLADQTHPPAKVKIIADERWFAVNKADVEAILGAKLGCDAQYFLDALYEYSEDLHKHTSRAKPLGPLVWKAIDAVDTDAFFIVKPEGTLFSNHIQSLCEVLARDEKALAAQSGVLIESRGESGTLARRLEYLALQSQETNILANQPRYEGTALYRAKLRRHLNPVTFSLLDGQEHNYLNVASYMFGEIAASFVASYCYREWEESFALSPIVPIEQQHQYARDGVRGLARRAEFVKLRQMPEVVFASPSFSPVQWNNLRRPTEVRAVANPNVRYEIRNGGDGLKFLQAGWSDQETDGIWIDGRDATLEFVLGLTSTEMEKLKKVTFVFDMEGRKEEATQRDQHVTIAVNNAPIRYMQVSARRSAFGRNQAWSSYSIEIPASVFDRNCAVQVRFSLDHAEPVVKAGATIDRRKLGLRVRSFTLHAEF